MHLRFVNVNHETYIQKKIQMTNTFTKNDTYALEVPPWSLSTCSTSATGSRNPLLHFGQASIVTFFTPVARLPPFSWTFSTWSTSVVTEANLAPHWGHTSTCPLLLPLLLLLGPFPSFAICHFWLSSLLSFATLASAEARKDEAAVRRLPHFGDDAAGAWLGFDTSFLLLLK